MHLSYAEAYQFISDGVNTARAEIDFSLRRAHPENEIRVSLSPDDREARIAFYGFATNIIGEFPAETEDFLSKVLSVEVWLDVFGGELNIVFHKK